MKKIVYVTGCLGFIGIHITELLLDRGWYVIGVDRMTYASNQSWLPKFSQYSNFTFLQCDINHLGPLRDCDYVINTAAETHVGNSIVSSSEFIKSNIDGVHNLLELIKNYRGENNGKPILLHISTDEVYGDITEGAHSEKDLLKPSNPYSATKAAADMLIMAWGRTHNIPFMILRPTNNYGLGQYTEKLIPKSVKYLTLGRHIPLHNNGESYRNWLHAADTAEAVITLIEKGSIGEVYNVSGDFEQKNITTVSKILNLFFNTKILENEFEKYIDFSTNRPGEDIRYALDDSKIKKLGWNPKVDFDQELTSIIEYYKTRFIW